MNSQCSGHFETKTIEELTETLIDYRGKTPKKTNDGVWLITAKVIKNGKILEDDREYIAAENYDAWMRRGLPRQWDILITTEAPLGEVAQLRTSEKIALAQRVILLRGNPNLVDQNYYFQALRSPFVQAELAARATGTTVLGIKQSELRQVRIPYFPMVTQCRIAAILSAYDDLIENNTRRIKILEQMAQAIYREWFVELRAPAVKLRKATPEEQKLTGKDVFPKGWDLRSVVDSVFVSPKTTVPKEGRKHFVPMASLTDNSMLIGDTQLKEGGSGSKFKNGDTLFARITPCLENGKTGFVQFLESDDDVAIGSTEFIVLRSKTLTPEYVYLMARSNEFRDNAIKSMSGATGRQRVQEESFHKFLIAQADNITLSKFSEVVRPMFQLTHSLSLKNTNLRRTRDLLLPKLISGEVAVEELHIEAKGGL